MSASTLLLEDGDLPADALSALVREREAWARRVGRALVCFTSAPLDPRAPPPSLLTVVDGAALEGEDGLNGLPTAEGLVRREQSTFRLLGRVAGSTDGADARGLLVGLTDCGDDAREAEFHRWYDVHHAADVLRSGRYFRGRRFERAHGSLPRFLALYETTGDEPATFRDYLAWAERDRTRCEVAVIRSVWTFRRVS